MAWRKRRSPSRRRKRTEQSERRRWFWQKRRRGDERARAVRTQKRSDGKQSAPSSRTQPHKQPEPARETIVDAADGADDEPPLGLCGGICGPTVMQEHFLEREEAARGGGSSAGISDRDRLAHRQRTVTVPQFHQPPSDSIEYELFDDGASVQILASLVAVMPAKPTVTVAEQVCTITLIRDEGTHKLAIELPYPVRTPPRVRLTNDILEITLRKVAA